MVFYITAFILNQWSNMGGQRRPHQWAIWTELEVLFDLVHSHLSAPISQDDTSTFPELTASFHPAQISSFSLLLWAAERTLCALHQNPPPSYPPPPGCQGRDLGRRPVSPVNPDPSGIHRLLDVFQNQGALAGMGSVL